jgi:hypothetical protein
MSEYDLLLVGGSSVLILALILFFSASWQDGSIKKSVMAFIFSGLLLAAADAQTLHGINPGDIPDSFARLITAIV